ncbi:PAS domain S-box protein [Azospirillum brasilense]|uniref:ATP-binding protein n=1 Tax=Azospirillum argentinense TaxID=2970906 RepID=UPI00190DEAA9|nr:ATP-binding protein [Azospirillum argentinense]MBK3800780.1 PAS domain S-box protein [Azospirillum argentinense]
MKRFVPFLLAILALAAPGMGRAETGAWVKSGPVEARLVASVQGVGDLAKIPLGLEVRLEPGWKTYWRTPGDAGFAPRLDWSESRNLKAAELIYPAPHRFTVLGFETAGYDAEVLFPIAATPAEPGKPLDLALKAELLVCSTICVPEMVALSLSIPEGPATPGPSANDIARAQSLVPGDGRASGLTVTAVRGPGARLAVSARDGPRRKEDERAIRRAVERHRSLLETAADAILLVDAKGTVHTYNRGAERIFGHSPADAVGTDVGRLIPGGLVPEPLSPDRLADGVAREVEGRRRDGLAVPLELSLSAWSDGGDRFFTAILRDITERKRTESALRRAKDQAERANRAKSRFLAAASHDLRQPVQSLFFLTSALDEQTRGTPGHDTLKTMQQALEALKRLLDGLLDISKLDAGVVEPVTTTVAIQPLFERLAAEYAPEAARRGLTLRVVPTTLHARSDPMLLERVVRNLLDNALRYTGRGGVLLGVRRSRRRFHIAVCDSGAGIPPDRQEDIFEEFTQLGNPERDREKGLGLGLAIVRRLCALLGHSVALRSRPGSGSTFLVTVPAAEPPRPAVTTVPAVGRTEGGGCRLVLIIDDEVIILMGLRAMLEGWGYEVIAATAGDEAIRLLDEAGRRPDVILADYRLRHGKTGPEALRAIHAHCRAAIPSIILTGDTAPERIVEAQRSGFAILHKPVSSHHLKQVVAEAGGR